MPRHYITLAFSARLANTPFIAWWLERLRIVSLQAFLWVARPRWPFHLAQRLPTRQAAPRHSGEPPWRLSTPLLRKTVPLSPFRCSASLDSAYRRHYFIRQWYWFMIGWCLPIIIHTLDIYLRPPLLSPPPPEEHLISPSRKIFHIHFRPPRLPPLRNLMSPQCCRRAQLLASKALTRMNGIEITWLSLYSASRWRYLTWMSVNVFTQDIAAAFHKWYRLMSSIN